MRSALELVKPWVRHLILWARGFLLRGIHPLLSNAPSAAAPAAPGNILFIRIDRLGDMVLSTPAYQAIKSAFPRSRLTVMASPANASILKNNPHLDDVILYDPFASLSEKYRLLKGLRGRPFDLAIDPCDDDEMETAWAAWMSGAGIRAGYAAYGREVFLNVSKQRNENKHFIEVTLDLLRTIGIPSGKSEPAVYFDADEQSWATQWIEEKGFQNKVLVAIHPGAYYDTQRWPAEYYADLIRLLRAHTEAEVIVFGGLTDAAVIARVLAKVSSPVCVFLQEDTRKFLALLSRCRVLVCNNSGPLHCAVALKVPTISFMGPTVKARWAPIGNIHQVLREDNLPCIGCNLGYCKIETHDCMRLIKPEKVKNLILEIMRSL